MNFSEPNRGAATLTTANTSNPLQLVHALFADTSFGTSLSTFTEKLYTIHLGTYLLLLPSSSPALHRFKTGLAADGPFGAAVFRTARCLVLTSVATRMERAELNESDDDFNALVRAQRLGLFEATGLMLQELEGAQQRYFDNVGILLGAFAAKLKGMPPHKRYSVSPTLIASAHDLCAIVKGHARPVTEPRPAYTSEIARYWRMWGKGEKWQYEYEEIWSFVAGRALPGE